MAALMGNNKNIAVIGFTGTINRCLVTHYLQEVGSKLAINIDDTEIHVFTRDHTSFSTDSNMNIHFYPGYSITDVAGENEKEENTERMLLLFKTLRISRVFICLPQSLSSTDMVVISNAFTDKILLSSGTVKTVVRISSYGLDNDFPTQGPLALAHKASEEYMRSKGLTVTSIRPTSFFSNFMKYDVASIMENSAFFSPLGYTATVNWIDNEDIAEVAAHCLLDTTLDGRILEITGPECNSFSAKEMSKMISEVIGKCILYGEISLPTFSADYEELWKYLRSDGFNVVTNTLKEVIGRDGHRFRDMPIFSTLAEHSRLEVKFNEMTSELKNYEDRLILESENATIEVEDMKERIRVLQEKRSTALVKDASSDNDKYQECMDEIDQIVGEFNRLNDTLGR